MRENLRGYTRVSIPQVCGDPISREDLTVWINHTGKWVNFDTSKLWQKKGPSLCRQLVNELGMSSAQYDSLRDVFDDVHSTDLVGLYQKGSKYVIVLRVPQTSIYDKLVVGGVSGFGGAVIGAATKSFVNQLAENNSKTDGSSVPNANYNEQKFKNSPGMSELLDLETEVEMDDDSGREMSEVQWNDFDALAKFYKYSNKLVNVISNVPPEDNEIVPQVTNMRNHLCELYLKYMENIVDTDFDSLIKTIKQEIKFPYLATAIVGDDMSGYNQEIQKKLKIATAYFEKLKHADNVPDLSSIKYLANKIIRNYRDIDHN